MALVDDHVGADRHVAGGAGERRIDPGMMAVLGALVFGGVALQADAIAGKAQLGAVRVVAVAAGDAGREHLALLERAVIVDLVEHLPVGGIEARGKRRDGVGFGQPAPRNPILGELAAARMAEAAGLDLLAEQAWRQVAMRIAGRGIGRPGDAGAVVEADQQPLARILALAERPPALLLLGPGDVRRALPVTGLAADIDLRPGGGEMIGRRIVVLAHAGRVALGAHEIPVLVQLRPVQEVAGADLLVGIEVEPALAALVLRAAVPGERERLQAAVGKLDEILLQRIDAEGVLDLEGGELAVGPVGLDQEFSVLAEEARVDAEIVEARIVEVAEHRAVGGVIHRELVLRGEPQLGLRLVAAGAGVAADELRRGERSGSGSAGQAAAERPGEELIGDAPANEDQRHERGRDQDFRLGQAVSRGRLRRTRLLFGLAGTRALRRSASGLGLGSAALQSTGPCRRYRRSVVFFTTRRNGVGRRPLRLSSCQERGRPAGAPPIVERRSHQSLPGCSSLSTRSSEKLPTSCRGGNSLNVARNWAT